MVRERARRVLGVSSGQRKEDKETWWWNEEVQENIQRKRLVKKKLDSQGDQKKYTGIQGNAIGGKGYGKGIWRIV